MNIKWSITEIELLKKLFPYDLTENIVNQFPNRTTGSIETKAKRLKIKKIPEISKLIRSNAHKGENNGMYGKTGPNKGKSPSDITRKKISIALKGKPNFNLRGEHNGAFGKPGSMLGKKMNPSSVKQGLLTRKKNFDNLTDVEKELKKNKQREQLIERLMVMSTTRTIPEKIVAQLLDELNISYEQEKQIGYYKCDFVINDNIIIEIQGDYWHGNPLIFKILNHVQQKNKNRDKAKKTYLLNKGYTVNYFWEYDIKNNINDVINSIKTICKI